MSTGPRAQQRTGHAARQDYVPVLCQPTETLQSPDPDGPKAAPAPQLPGTM
jgi:hypothetical protein